MHVERPNSPGGVEAEIVLPPKDIRNADLKGKLAPDGQIPKAAQKGGLTLARRLVVYFLLPADSFSVPNAFGTWKVF